MFKNTFLVQKSLSKDNKKINESSVNELLTVQTINK